MKKISIILMILVWSASVQADQVLSVREVLDNAHGFPALDAPITGKTMSVRESIEFSGGLDYPAMIQEKIYQQPVQGRQMAVREAIIFNQWLQWQAQQHALAKWQTQQQMAHLVSLQLLNSAEPQKIPELSEREKHDLRLAASRIEWENKYSHLWEQYQAQKAAGKENIEFETEQDRIDARRREQQEYFRQIAPYLKEYKDENQPTKGEYVASGFFDLVRLILGFAFLMIVAVAGFGGMIYFKEFSGQTQINLHE